MIGKDININGPYNITRLEGDINGVHKVIYLFFDVHTFDYECTDIDAIDVSKYILKIFRKAKKSLPDITYDFFVETFIRSERVEYDNLTRRNYIQQVRKFFYNLRKHNRILTEEMNVRLHHTDFRDYIGLFNIMNLLKLPANITNNIFTSMYATGNDMDEIIKSFEQFSSNVSYIEHLLTDKVVKVDIKNMNKFKDPKSDICKKDVDDLLNNFFYKMRYSYNNDELKATLVPIIDKMRDEMENLKSDIDKFIKFVKSKKAQIDSPYPELNNGLMFITKLASEMKQQIISLKDKYSLVLALSIDIFMIRRFLDKDYVTNALYYSGGSHSVNIMIILAKYFNFKVTHISKSSVSVDELTDILKQTDLFNSDIVDKIIKVDYQCSSLSGFPDLLT